MKVLRRDRHNTVKHTYILHVMNTFHVRDVFVLTL
jgi:hypothetical protein